MKRIVIAGGTGFLGKALIDHFLKEGAEITVLTRLRHQDKERLKYVAWDGCTQGKWAKALNGADVLINLCGKSVDCRYSEKNKKEILRSRIDSTSALGRAVESQKAPPAIWINASSATIYPYTEDQDRTEESAIGNDFSENVCRLWEEAFFKFRLKKTRQIAIRSSLVFGVGGSVYQTMKQLAILGLGGTQGSGKQYVSWIHIDDFIRAVEFICNQEEVNGIVNVCSPDPRKNHQFNRLLRTSLGVKFHFPLKTWMLKIGAFLMKTETELILKSRRVIPKKLLEMGFQFKYGRLEQALRALALEENSRK